MVPLPLLLKSNKNDPIPTTTLEEAQFMLQLEAKLGKTKFF